MRLLFVLFILLTSCKQVTEHDTVVQWISDNAEEIKTTDPGNDNSDLTFLNDVIGDSKIVSLGEPTHGNKEVFQLKHRMIKYLVEEKSFNLFALECPFAEAYDVNRYVLDGIGDPEKALAGIYYWAWDTKEVAALLKWMRSYNANPNNTRKIIFYGFDVQNPERAARELFKYLNKVDADLKSRIYPELGNLEISYSNPELIGLRQYIPEEYDLASLQTIKSIVTSFEKNKTAYINNSSKSEWILGKQYARQVEMYIEACFNEGENYTVVRDLGQAQNLQWILDNEPSDTKMIIWAHNSHVSNSSRWNANWMGYYMKKWYGDDLKIFCILFNQGQFKAIDEDIPSKGMHNFNVGPAMEGTLEYAISKTDANIAAIDLDKVPKSGIIFDYFDQERPTRNSGGGYNMKYETEFYWPYNLIEAFDALVYLNKTSAVINIDGDDYNHMWLITEKQDKPNNAGFENNKSGEAPNNWVCWSKFKRLGAEMVVSDEKPYSGNNSLKLYREKGLTYGEITPSIRQYINAKPYRGKKIKLHFAARSEVDETSLAFVRLCVDPEPLQNAHDGLPPLFDSLDEYRIHSEAWKTYEIEATIPENADIIHYGIYLRDFGTAWLDNVDIEIIDQ